MTFGIASSSASKSPKVMSRSGAICQRVLLGGNFLDHLFRANCKPTYTVTIRHVGPKYQSQDAGSQICVGRMSSETVGPKSKSSCC